MSKRSFVAGLIGLLALVVWLESRDWKGPKATAQPARGASSTSDKMNQRLAPTRSEPPEASIAIEENDQVTLLAAAETTIDLHSKETTGEDDIHLLDSLFIAYRQALKTNPSGENYEILEALTGRNRKSIAVIPADHTAISSSGELLDRWGTPYHFHSLSAHQMEIRSAGPDQKLWSEDDNLLD